MTSHVRGVKLPPLREQYPQETDDLARAMLTRDFSTLHRCLDCYRVEAGHLMEMVASYASARSALIRGDYSDDMGETDGESEL